MTQAAYREQVYEIFADPEADLETKVNEAFAVGREYLNLSLGFLTELSNGTQLVVHAVGDHPSIQAGETCPLEEAYCRRTVESEGSLAIQDVRDTDIISREAVARFNLNTYVGAKVLVDDELYGTVCFGDMKARSEPFTDAETFFVEMIASLVGQTLERERYEAELDEREQALNEREEIYRAVIDASFDLVFRLDTSGQFTYLSPSVEELLGYDTETHLGESFVEFLPAESTVQVASDLFDRLMQGETVEEEYFPLVDADDNLMFVDIRATPVYESTSQPRERENITAIQGMARDATDRFRRERLIEVLNRVLRHNIRNDMTVIRGFAEVLEGRLSGENKRLTERIIQTSDRLIDLTETARRLEQNADDTHRVEPMDVVAVIQNAAAQTRQRYPDATVSVDAPERLRAQCADRLEMAVWELADNAAKHAGGSPVVDLSVTEREAHVVVTVADDGPGLPANERTVLVSGEETPLIHGSGLGLWLVHWIVTSLDGELTVRETARGTAVEILLRKPE